MKTLVQDFVCHKLLFLINKENFRIFDKILVCHGLKTYFQTFLFSQIFWSELVGTIDIFIAADIANMLSLWK